MKMATRGWVRSSQELLHIRLLDWLAEGDRIKRYPVLQKYRSEVNDSATDDELEEAARALEAVGLVATERSLAPRIAAPYHLTEAGRVSVSDRDVRRRDRAFRRVATRDALLDWLYEGMNIQTGESPELSAFGGVPQAHFEGDSLTTAEVTDAGRFLVAEGYLRGTSVWGDEVIRPKLTSLGQQVVESQSYTRRASTSSPTSSTTNITVGHNSGQIASGNAVNQTQSDGLRTEELLRLISEVRMTVSDIPDEARGSADAYLTIIETEAAESSPSSSSLATAGKALLNLGDKVANATTQASIDTLWLYMCERFGLPH